MGWLWAGGGWGWVWGRDVDFGVELLDMDEGGLGVGVDGMGEVSARLSGVGWALVRTVA